MIRYGKPCGARTFQLMRSLQNIRSAVGRWTLSNKTAISPPLPWMICAISCPVRWRRSWSTSRTKHEKTLFQHDFPCRKGVFLHQGISFGQQKMTEFSLLCCQHIALFHGLSTPFSTFVGIILSHLPGFQKHFFSRCWTSPEIRKNKIPWFSFSLYNYKT